MTISITTEEFKENIFDFSNETEFKYKGDKPAIIDFWAEWCAPCKMLSPVLEELSQELDGKINIYKVNTDEEQDLAITFGIQSIPTLIFIPLEGPVRLASGAPSKQDLKSAIKEILGVE